MSGRQFWRFYYEKTLVGGRAGEGFRLELPVVVLFQESGRVVAAARTLEEVQTLPKYTSLILLSNTLKTKEIKEKRNVLIFFLSHIFFTFFTTVKGVGGYHLDSAPLMRVRKRVPRGSPTWTQKRYQVKTLSSKKRPEPQISFPAKKHSPQSVITSCTRCACRGPTSSPPGWPPIASPPTGPSSRRRARTGCRRRRGTGTGSGSRCCRSRSGSSRSLGRCANFEFYYLQLQV